MARTIISFFLLITSLNVLGQVSPTITITSDKSVITIGESINFTASFSGGGAGPKLEWKKNGVIVGSNSANFSDNTLKDGDKIACVLTSNDPQRAINVVASNFLSPIVNPVQINPTLTGEGIAGKAISLNSNVTQKVVWKKDGVQIPNPINGYLGNGISIAGGGNSNIDLKGPRGIFYESFTNTLYVLDQTRVLKFTNNSLIGNIIIDQLNNSTDIWIDKYGKVYILSSYEIKIFEPGSTTPYNIISTQESSGDQFFVSENGSIYISCSFKHVIKKYNPNSKIFIAVAGSENVSGSTNSLLNFPRGIFVNSKNEIFISDQSNHRIVKWVEGEKSGLVVAGGNGQSVYNNNIFDNKLSYPTDVSVDESGNVYVAEANGARISKWDPYQNSSLVVGGNGQGTSLNKMSSWVSSFKLINDVFFICDTGNKRVLKWKIGDSQSTLVAGNFESNSFLHTPNDIKLNNGELYIADRFNFRIQKWDLKAKKGTFFLNFNTNPNYLDFDNANNLYISDDGNNRIKKWDNNFLSNYAGLTKGNTLNSLNNPQGIKFDKNNNLFIVDSGNNRILKWPLNSNEGGILVAGSGTNGNSSLELNNPIDIEIDNNENYYVLDSGNNRIQKFSKNDQNGITIFGLNVPIGNNLLLNKPTGLYLNSKNELIITDKNNHRILKFNPTNLSTILIAGGKGDGIGSNQLYSPNKAIEDSEGNLLVADSQNHRIQKFTIENNQSLIPTTPGNYTATVTTQFGEFTTPIYKILAQDTDKDGVEDAEDKCLNTPIGEPVDQNGCSLSQKDSDKDGVNDKLDKCPDTKIGVKVDVSGCADYQKDTDKDGITDDLDLCPNTPFGEQIDLNGCSLSQKDTDKDGINDKLDKCPNTTNGLKVDSNGCADYQRDSDNDGINDSLDKCPDTAAGTKVDAKGCSDAQITCNSIKPNLNVNSNFEISTTTVGTNYIWFLDDQLIFEGKLLNFTPVKSGKYSIKVLVSDKCLSSMSDYISVLITGNELESKYLNAYPNPFDKEIKIQIPIEFGNDAKIKIIDLKGSVIFLKDSVVNNEVLYLNYLATGTYFLTIESNDFKLKNMIKLIKK